jgi:hypothetical protein
MSALGLPVNHVVAAGFSTTVWIRTALSMDVLIDTSPRERTGGSGAGSSSSNALVMKGCQPQPKRWLTMNSIAVDENGYQVPTRRTGCDLGLPGGAAGSPPGKKVNVNAAVGRMVDGSHPSRVLHRVVSYDLAHIPPTEAPTSL